MQRGAAAAAMKFLSSSMDMSLAIPEVRHADGFTQYTANEAANLSASPRMCILSSETGANAHEAGYGEQDALCMARVRSSHFTYLLVFAKIWPMLDNSPIHNVPTLYFPRCLHDGRCVLHPCPAGTCCQPEPEQWQQMELGGFLMSGRQGQAKRGRATADEQECKAPLSHTVCFCSLVPREAALCTSQMSILGVPFAMANKRLLHYSTLLAYLVGYPGFSQRGPSEAPNQSSIACS
eukprot:1160879-Pelagomonas_calceolata.AAC.4